MICLDNTFLVLLFNPNAPSPQDPQTKKPIERLKERISFLKTNWEESKEKIIIPTPVLAEFLIFAKEEGHLYLNKLTSSSNFLIRDFDQRAAVEIAAIYLSKWGVAGKNEKKLIEKIHPASKLKFDRQIVSIAKVNGATTLYTDDHGMKNFAESQGIKVVNSWTLPLPPAVQPDLFDGQQQAELKAEKSPSSVIHHNFLPSQRTDSTQLSINKEPKRINNSETVLPEE